MEKQRLMNYPGFALDALERVFWTIAQLAGGAFIAWTVTGDPWSWQTFGYAIGLAAAKQVVARQVGGKTARALPGHSDDVREA